MPSKEYNRNSHIIHPFPQLTFAVIIPWETNGIWTHSSFVMCSIKWYLYTWMSAQHSIHPHVLHFWSCSFSKKHRAAYIVPFMLTILWGRLSEEKITNPGSSRESHHWMVSWLLVSPTWNSNHYTTLDHIWPQKQCFSMESAHTVKRQAINLSIVMDNQAMRNKVNYMQMKKSSFYLNKFHAI